MRIVSWNVAGWQSTLQQIIETYGSLEAFLSVLDADVFCVQEAKVPSSLVRDKPASVAANIKEFESFWACCSMDHAQGRYSGCATWARNGLTCSANAAPLEGTDTDCWTDEGRCLLTDHEQFVALNVYAPASGDGQRSLQVKLSFLHALQRKVNDLRAAGRSVVVCGDLNVAGAADVYPLDRLVSLDSLPGDYGLRVRQTLERAEVRSILGKRHGGTAPMARQETSYRVFVPTGKGMAPLTTGFESEVEARRRSKDLDRLMVADVLLKDQDHLALRHIIDVLQKAHNINLSVSEKEWLQDHAASYFPPATLDALLALSLTDSFRAAFPDAKNRFTAWPQYSNGRYTNEGARLDYILLTPDLVPQLNSKRRLYSPGVDDHSSAAASLVAATAGGFWKEAPRTGGGLTLSENVAGAIESVVDSIHIAKETGAGIIYTSPRWSDHVSVMVKLQLCSKSTQLSDDPDTKKAQPQRTFRSITSFFGTPRKPPTALVADTDTGRNTGSGASRRQDIFVDVCSSQEDSMEEATRLAVPKGIQQKQLPGQMVVDLLDSPPPKRPRRGTLDAWVKR